MIIVFTFIYFQTIEDTNGTNILDQSVIKKGRKNDSHARTHAALVLVSTQKRPRLVLLWPWAPGAPPR